MKTYEIKHRYTGRVLYSGEGETLAAVVVKAASEKTYLRDADLSGADLEPIKLDIYDVFSAAPADVPRFLDVLRAGKIDGSVYNDGAECVCLVGTFEKLQGCGKDGVVVRDSNRPAERFFLAIRPGNTPSNHWAAKLVEEWTEKWMASNPIPNMSAGA